MRIKLTITMNSTSGTGSKRDGQNIILHIISFQYTSFGSTSYSLGCEGARCRQPSSNSGYHIRREGVLVGYTGYTGNVWLQG